MLGLCALYSFSATEYWKIDTLKLLGAGSIQHVSMYFCIKGVMSKLPLFFFFFFLLHAGVIGSGTICILKENAI